MKKSTDKLITTHEMITDCDHGRQPIVKSKKKPYLVEVEGKALGFYWLVLKGRNGFYMACEYESLRECRQMAKRLAKNLGIEYRQ